MYIRAFFKPTLNAALTSALMAYAVKHTVEVSRAQIIHRYVFVPRGRQQPLNIVVEERHERGFIFSKSVTIAVINKNTQNTKHLKTVEELLVMLMPIQAKKAKPKYVHVNTNVVDRQNKEWADRQAMKATKQTPGKKRELR